MAALMNLREAEAKLLQLIDRAAAGEEILIARDGVPVARLVPLEARPMRRTPGGWEHGVQIADDFDAPLPQL
jgi:prevent-host-death family protein